MMYLRHSLLLAGFSGLGGIGCVDAGSLAISAGAPAGAAVQGRITDCGRAASGAVIVFRVQQNEQDQARPVDVEIGPVTTGRDGRYAVEISPPFAVPGPAQIQLQTVNGITIELAGPQLSFSLGLPPRDTLRFDADVGSHRGSCLPG